MASILLRKDIKVSFSEPEDEEGERNGSLWTYLDEDIRVFIKNAVLSTFKTISAEKSDLARNVCHLAVEIAGAMVEYQEEKT